MLVWVAVEFARGRSLTRRFSHFAITTALCLFTLHRCLEFLSRISDQHSQLSIDFLDVVSKVLGFNKLDA